MNLDQFKSPRSLVGFITRLDAVTIADVLFKSEKTVHNGYSNSRKEELLLFPKTP